MRSLLNSVALHPDRPDYLLLPELAMPARWFPEFARGLRRSGISLVAGVEHQRRGRNAVTNQVWAALRLEGMGLPFLVYQQDKQRPARPELEKLLEPLGMSLKPMRRWSLPPVIEHGGFRFALLICSELTNIDYRAHLRGAIDALFIPEWNQDLHSFEALVESSALDLHAYIAQANTRGFGDTRLRAPMAKEWERDVVRLKGGSHDYFVVGQIDILQLRSYQLSDGLEQAPVEEVSAPGKKTYKPLPDGYKMDSRRV
jgi:predicted amidohydrolase